MKIEIPHLIPFLLFRGFFPLYELCGSILAMNLARRDILGERMNRLQLFFVAVALNAYGVFRVSRLGLLAYHSLKPIFHSMYFIFPYPPPPETCTSVYLCNSLGFFYA